MRGVAGVDQELQRQRQPNRLGTLTIQGDSPVGVTASPPLCSAFQSSADAVELRVNLGGPPSKAKYYITTDSDQ